MDYVFISVAYDKSTRLGVHDTGFVSTIYADEKIYVIL